MGYCESCGREHNVGFISTRFAGTDGAALETVKWADVFHMAGFTCYYFAGELDRDEDRSYLVPEAHFKHPDVVDIYRICFGTRAR